MRNALAIARKELSIYFTTPWAYVVMTVMAFLSALFFIGGLQQFQFYQEQAQLMGQFNRLPPELRNLTDGVVVALWQTLLIITLFVAPFLSMRLFSEEKRQKTFELLMTTPLTPWQIVLGKYLGGLGAISAALALNLAFPIVLSIFGSSETGSALEWPTVMLGFGGVWLFGAAWIAVGMFISSLTESQMVAAVVTFAFALAWFVLNFVVTGLEGPLRSTLEYLSFSTQLGPLMRGSLEPKAVVFFLSIVLTSLLLTHRSVEAQRWA